MPAVLCGLQAIRLAHPSLAAGEAMRAYDGQINIFRRFPFICRGRSITEI